MDTRRKATFQVGMVVFLSLFATSFMPTSVSAATNSSNSTADVVVKSSGNSNVEVDYVSISNTGPDSNNEVEITDNSEVDIENDNNVVVENKNPQFAETGDAVVQGNTTGGDARSGDATNVSTTDVCVDINNSSVARDSVCEEPEAAPEEPGRGGGGEVLGEQVAAVGGAGAGGLGAGEVSALPVTGVSNNWFEGMVALVASALAFAGIRRLEKTHSFSVAASK